MRDLSNRIAILLLRATHMQVALRPSRPQRHRLYRLRHLLLKLVPVLSSMLRLLLRAAFILLLLLLLLLLPLLLPLLLLLLLTPRLVGHRGR